MPGMMDTVLNLGFNDEAVEGIAKKSKANRPDLPLGTKVNPSPLVSKNGNGRIFFLGEWKPRKVKKEPIDPI